MGNIMSLKNVKNNPSRSGFDLSKRNLFTAKCGELLPVYCKEVIPGDSFEINTKWITRTSPVQTAAFTRIREYYDWFFVPTNLLWDKFGQFVAQTEEAMQAASITSAAILGDTHPFLTQQDIDNYLHNLADNFAYDFNIFNMRRSVLSCKLLEYLGYGSYYDQLNDDIVHHNEDVALNPFPILAYQKIYQDYFRNSQWEKGAPWTCNLNYMNPSSATANMKINIDSLSSSFSQNLFDLRYANWNKDYFMGILPNSQFGDAASVIDYNANFKYLNPSTNNMESVPELGDPIKIAYVNSQTDSVHLGISSSNPHRLYVTTNFSILALRQAEALQKWKEVTQAHQKDYKAQMEAHFGVTMSDAYSDRCKFIDGIVNDLSINEQVNTNLTEDNRATIAGKGIGTGNGRATYSTKVHGYLMCIYHAVPIMDYSITGVARQNLKTVVTDYAIPEMDKTGMVQLPFIELCNTEIEGLPIRSGTLLGYVPRYLDYKSDFDTVNGNFRWSDDSWVAAFTNEYIKQYMLSVHSGQTGLYNLNINYVFFKVNPHILDKIFAVDANDKYDTDQFKTNVYFNVKCVRNLDYNGLPY